MPQDPLRSAPPTPAWVKLAGVALVLLVAAVAVLHLSGHGLGGHGVH